VVGFAQGEFSPPDLYVVREQDEHAWPEGLFPRDWVGGIRAYQQPGAPSCARPAGTLLATSAGEGGLHNQAVYLISRRMIRRVCAAVRRLVNVGVYGERKRIRSECDTAVGFL